MHLQNQSLLSRLYQSCQRKSTPNKKSQNNLTTVKIIGSTPENCPKKEYLPHEPTRLKNKSQDRKGQNSNDLQNQTI